MSDVAEDSRAWHGYSLSRAAEKLYPDKLLINGGVYGINADFRNVLKIFRLLEDDGVFEQHKYSLLRAFFYRADGLDAPLPDIADAMRGFVEFIERGRAFERLLLPDDVRESGERQLDYELDAPEIFASFLSEYSIDLEDVRFLHFYKFRMLLTALSPNSQFMRKLAVRFMDLTGLKGRELAKASALKESVRLPERLTKEEKVEALEFERIWGQI